MEPNFYSNNSADRDAQRGVVNHGASTWLEIDEDAIRNNVKRLKEISQRPLMAVIKANAYGHGIVDVACAAASAGADWFGVARIEEALTLRRAGITRPILVLSYTLPERVPEAIQSRIHLTIFDPELIDAYADQAAGVGQAMCVHLKVDTGMGRYGVGPQEAAALARKAAARKEIQVEGLFTHFARADEPELPTTTLQLKQFVEVVECLESLGLRPACVHASNSAATLYAPQARFDLVRAGIAMYGLHPNWPERQLPAGFLPALAWKARLASVKMLPPGHGVGYGHTYVTRGEERIGVIPIGYADGFRRDASHQVLIHGKRLTVIPRVCMDNCMLNLDSVPDAQVGDEVVIIGTQGEQSIRVEEIARRWKTINYEVVCGLDARLPRIYTHS
jgi:alanine racemase